jgi:hypothetical protein
VAAPETFTCPRCGGEGDYDPKRVERLLRTEEEGSRYFWSDYSLVRCPRCGHEALVLRRRDKLP